MRRPPRTKAGADFSLQLHVPVVEAVRDHLVPLDEMGVEAQEPLVMAGGLVAGDATRLVIDPCAEGLQHVTFHAAEVFPVSFGYASHHLAVKDDSAMWEPTCRRLTP